MTGVGPTPRPVAVFSPVTEVVACSLFTTNWTCEFAHGSRVERISEPTGLVEWIDVSGILPGVDLPDGVAVGTPMHAIVAITVAVSEFGSDGRLARETA